MGDGSRNNRSPSLIRDPGHAICAEDWCSKGAKIISLMFIFPESIAEALNAAPAMPCSESDEPWPLAADFAILNAPFTASRNYFSGALSPPVGRLTTAPAFYSTAPVVRDQSTWWLLAAVDRRVHLLDGATEQVVDKSGWGSEIAGVRSGCG